MPVSFAPFIAGFEDDTFRGNSVITREQFIAILHRLQRPQAAQEGANDDTALQGGENTATQDGRVLAGQTAEGGAGFAAQEPAFKDVLPGRWSYDALAWAKEAGVIEADAEGNFNPSAPLTRAEVALTLVKINGLTEQAEDAFTDLAGHPDRADILKAVQAGLFGGYPDGSFKPDSPSTRAEVVAVLIRYLLGGEPGEEQWRGIELSFSDVAPSYWAYRYIALATKGR